jgi:hypothetical protein
MAFTASLVALRCRTSGVGALGLCVVVLRTYRLSGFLWLAGGGFWNMGGDDAKHDGIWAG